MAHANGPRAIVAGCNCGGSKSAAKLTWAVDLTGTGKTFTDGSLKKTYALANEANAAIAALGLTGKVRPRPANA